MLGPASRLASREKERLSGAKSSSLPLSAAAPRTVAPAGRLNHLLVALGVGTLLCAAATLGLYWHIHEPSGGDPSQAAPPPVETFRDELPAGEDVLHFLWVSDCSGYQEWQSLSLLWSIYRAQGANTGVTRLISGCSDEDRAERLRAHAEMFPRAGGQRAPLLFFTSGHVRDEGLNDTYPPYNRPHSIALWVETQPLHHRTWVVLLDPDMVMLAPLRLPTAAASGGAGDEQKSEQYLYSRKMPLASALRLRALGQRYEYMSKRWGDAALRLDEICEAGAEACLALSGEAVAEHFAVGPPWIVRFQDLRQAAPLWKAYTPRIRRQYRKLIAEMYAYSLAFASIGVRHALFDHFVVSYPHAPPGEQAWPWVDGHTEDKDDCGGIPDPHADGRPMPTFLHYCEVYHSEDWYFQKRDVPHKEVLSCEAPLFAVPPADWLRKRRKSTEGDAEDWARQSIRHAWYLCNLLPTLNGAVAAARAALCPGGAFNETRGLRVPLPKGEFYAALSEFFKGST